CRTAPTPTHTLSLHDALPILDELPQFFNVLRGEMTLVGPRPPLPYEVESYNLYHKMRLSGKPGLTGPWQIYGRSRVPFETMVERSEEHTSEIQSLAYLVCRPL